MKILQASLICFIAFTLSGCATGYYQRGYTGYNTGYSQRYYRSYDNDYYRPSTGFGFRQYYEQPGYGHERHEYRTYQPERHHDSRPPFPRFNHQEGGRGDWGGRHERHEDSGPRQNQQHGGEGHSQHRPEAAQQPRFQPPVTQQQEHRFGESRGPNEGGGRGGQHQPRERRHGERPE